MNLDETRTFLAKHWDSKSLAMLRMESLQKANGTAFEFLRREDNSRTMLMVGLTSESQIAMLEKVMDLGKEILSADWEKLTWAEMAIRTVESDGLGYEISFDASGKRTAVALCATSPEMVGLIKRLFQL